MHDIFICYRREDSIDVASHVFDWLDVRLPPRAVFMDVDSINPGTDFREAIEDSVARAGVVLVVIGQKWLSLANDAGRRRLDDPADHLRIEIEIAIQHNIPIIPLLLHGARMPSAAELPAPFASLAYRQAIPLRPSPDFVRDMERVAKAIEAYAPTISLHPPSPPAGSGGLSVVRPRRSRLAVIDYSWLIGWATLATVLSLACIALFVVADPGPTNLPVAEALAAHGIAGLFVYHPVVCGVYFANLAIALLPTILAWNKVRAIRRPGWALFLLFGGIIAGLLALPSLSALIFGLRRPTNWASDEISDTRASYVTVLAWSEVAAIYSILTIVSLVVPLVETQTLSSSARATLSATLFVCFWLFLLAEVPNTVVACVLAYLRARRQRQPGWQAFILFGGIITTPLLLGFFPPLISAARHMRS